MSDPIARTSSIVSSDLLIRLGAGGEHDPAAARRGHLLGKEQPEAAQAAGDDVGAVAAEDLNLFRGQHHAAAPRARDVEDEFAGVFGRAHHPNRGGRLGKRVMGALRHRQHAVGGERVYRVQQVADWCGVGERHQRQVDSVERQVATEREQAQLGVAVDVAFPDLDEPPAQGQAA